MRISRWFLLGLALIASACGGGGGDNGPGPQPGRSKWTVLVFMNAANDLSQFAPLNMNQLERVAGNPEVRFVVQWKQSTDLAFPTKFNGTRRYLVKPDSSNDINSTVVQEMGTHVDMGQVATLREFVTWARAEYPSDRLALIVWNHGNGWQRGPASDEITRGVSYDDQTGNSIQTWELAQATAGLGIDLLAFDSSLMQMVEVAYEMRANVPFIVGSEESPPGEGYPYDLVFAPWRDNPTASTETLSKSFVDGMVNNPPYVNRKITQSVLRSSKLGDVATAASGLATTLIAHPELSDEIRDARVAAQPYSSTPDVTTRQYYDMMGFAEELSARVAVQDVKDACAALKAALGAAILWNGHNAQSAQSRGLAVDLSKASQFATKTVNYQRMQWAADTTWDEWLTVAP
ncbi:MAG: clostripain-related cysteine peptidase [Fimbriimonas sp.]